MSAFILALILSCSPSGAAASSAGVTSDNMVLDLSASLTGVDTVSSREIHEDLAFLKTALTKGYAGPDILRQVDAIPTEATSSQGLCSRLAAVFDSVRDAHLRAGLEFRSCGQVPKPGRVGENLASEGWLLKTVEHGGVATDVLAIPSFWPKYDAKWNGFLEAVKTLRGNRGGDDSMGFELARILLGMPDHVNLPTPVERRYFRQTPEAFAIQANHWAWAIMKLKASGRPVPAYMTQRRDEVLSWMERAQEGQFPVEYIETLPAPELDESLVFQPEVYVLIDRACASSCETAMQVLERLPRRILVGENTLGAVEYGDVGRVILPHSRISVSLSTMSVHFRDGRQVEKSGYAPDLRVPESGDALVTALSAIRGP